MLKLKQIRKESGIKVVKIAEMLGITRRHYYDLEKGSTPFTNDKIQKLARVFGVDYSYLKEVISNAGDNRIRN